jgi:hydroxymethylpyrimidine pyrophosphatase-like HAD family hydrolase
LKQTTAPADSVRAPVRLIALDLDGTALGRDELHAWLEDGLVEVLNGLAARGIDWCTNSGRNHSNQIGIIHACRPLLHMPVAVLGGERFIHWLRPKFAPHQPFNSVMQRKMDGLHPQVIAALAPHRERFRATYEFNHEQDVDGVVGWNLVDSARTPVFEAELKSIVSGIAEAQVLRNNDWIIVTHRDAGKGVILAETARHLGIPRESVLAIGDHHNDLDMLDGRAAGHVGCPGDSDELVKTAVRAAGGIVSDLPHALGTADIIKRLTL